MQQGCNSLTDIWTKQSFHLILNIQVNTHNLEFTSSLNLKQFQFFERNMIPKKLKIDNLTQKLIRLQKKPTVETTWQHFHDKRNYTEAYSKTF